MAIIRLERTIVYEGDSDWLEKVLDKSLKVGKPIQCGRVNASRVRTIEVKEEQRTVVGSDKPIDKDELPYG